VAACFVERSVELSGDLVQLAEHVTGMSDADFPEPVVVKSRCLLWRRADVEAWASGARDTAVVTPWSQKTHNRAGFDNMPPRRCSSKTPLTRTDTDRPLLVVTRSGGFDSRHPLSRTSTARPMRSRV
jgi:hypothetical protein